MVRPDQVQVGIVLRDPGTGADFLVLRVHTAPGPGSVRIDGVQFGRGGQLTSAGTLGSVTSRRIPRELLDRLEPKFHPQISGAIRLAASKVDSHEAGVGLLGSGTSSLKKIISKIYTSGDAWVDLPPIPFDSSPPNPPPGSTDVALISAKQAERAATSAGHSPGSGSPMSEKYTSKTKLLRRLRTAEITGVGDARRVDLSPEDLDAILPSIPGGTAKDRAQLHASLSEAAIRARTQMGDINLPVGAKSGAHLTEAAQAVQDELFLSFWNHSQIDLKMGAATPVAMRRGNAARGAMQSDLMAMLTAPINVGGVDTHSGLEWLLGSGNVKVGADAMGTPIVKTGTLANVGRIEDRAIQAAQALMHTPVSPDTSNPALFILVDKLRRAGVVTAEGGLSLIRRASTPATAPTALTPEDAQTLLRSGRRRSEVRLNALKHRIQSISDASAAATFADENLYVGLEALMPDLPRSEVAEFTKVVNAINQRTKETRGGWAPEALHAIGFDDINLMGRQIHSSGTRRVHTEFNYGADNPMVYKRLNEYIARFLKRQRDVMAGELGAYDQHMEELYQAFPHLTNSAGERADAAQRLTNSVDQDLIDEMGANTRQLPQSGLTGGEWKMASQYDMEGRLAGIDQSINLTQRNINNAHQELAALRAAHTGPHPTDLIRNKIGYLQDQGAILSDLESQLAEARRGARKFGTSIQSSAGMLSKDMVHMGEAPGDYVRVDPKTGLLMRLSFSGEDVSNVTIGTGKDAHTVQVPQRATATPVTLDQKILQEQGLASENSSVAPSIQIRKRNGELVTEESIRASIQARGRIETQVEMIAAQPTFATEVDQAWANQLLKKVKAARGTGYKFGVGTLLGVDRNNPNAEDVIQGSIAETMLAYSEDPSGFRSRVASRRSGSELLATLQIGKRRYDQANQRAETTFGLSPSDNLGIQNPDHAALAEGVDPFLAAANRDETARTAAGLRARATKELLDSKWESLEGATPQIQLAGRQMKVSVTAGELLSHIEEKEARLQSMMDRRRLVLARLRQEGIEASRQGLPAQELNSLTRLIGIFNQGIQSSERALALAREARQDIQLDASMIGPIAKGDVGALISQTRVMPGLNEVLGHIADTGTLGEYKVNIGGADFIPESLPIANLPGRPAEFSGGGSSGKASGSKLEVAAEKAMREGAQIEDSLQANANTPERTSLLLLRAESGGQAYALGGESAARQLEMAEISRTKAVSQSYLNAHTLPSNEKLGLWKYGDQFVGDIPDISKQIQNIQAVNEGRRGMIILDIETKGTQYETPFEAAVLHLQRGQDGQLHVEGRQAWRGADAGEQANAWISAQMAAENPPVIGVWGTGADTPKIGLPTEYNDDVANLMALDRLRRAQGYSPAVEDTSLELGVRSLLQKRQHRAAYDTVQEAKIAQQLLPSWAGLDPTLPQQLTVSDLQDLLVTTRREASLQVPGMGRFGSGREYRIKSVLAGSTPETSQNPLYQLVMEPVHVIDGRIVPMQGVPTVRTGEADIGRLADIMEEFKVLPNDPTQMAARQEGIAQHNVNRLIHRALAGETANAARPYGGLSNRHEFINQLITDPERYSVVQLLRGANGLTPEEIGHLDYYEQYVHNDPRMRRQWGELGTYIEEQWKPLHQPFFDTLDANPNLSPQEKEAAVKLRYASLYGTEGSLREVGNLPMDPGGMRLTPRAQVQGGGFENLRSIETASPRTIGSDLRNLGLDIVRRGYEDIPGTERQLLDLGVEPAVARRVASLGRDWTPERLAGAVGGADHVRHFQNMVGERAILGNIAVGTEGDRIQDVVRRSFGVAGQEAPAMTGSLGDMAAALHAHANTPGIAENLLRQETDIRGGSWFIGMGQATDAQRAAADEWMGEAQAEGPSRRVSRAAYNASAADTTKLPFREDQRLGAVGTIDSEFGINMVGRTPQQVIAAEGEKGKFMLASLMGRADSPAFPDISMEDAQRKQISEALGWSGEQVGSYQVPIRRTVDGATTYSSLTAEQIIAQAGGSEGAALRIIGVERQSLPPRVYQYIEQQMRAQRQAASAPVAPLGLGLPDVPTAEERVNAGAQAVAAATTPAEASATSAGLANAENIGLAGARSVASIAGGGGLPPPTTPAGRTLANAERGMPMLAGALAVGGILMMAGYLKKRTRQEDEDRVDRPALMGEKPVYNNPNITNINFRVNGVVRAVAPDQVDHAMIIDSVHSAMESFSNTEVKRTHQIRDARDPQLATRNKYDHLAKLL